MRTQKHAHAHTRARARTHARAHARTRAHTYTHAHARARRYGVELQMKNMEYNVLDDKKVGPRAGSVTAP
jgi:hypothetical protein